MCSSDLRVTDEETIDIVEMVLGGLVNKEIVSLINRHGGMAVGLTGKDGGLITAVKKVIRKMSDETGMDEVIDLGLVGKVKEVNPAILESLESNGFIPVVAPVGVSSDGVTMNINADSVASVLASALGAEKLILLTDVAGINDMKDQVVSTAKSRNIKKMIQKGTISGGMIPKVQACMDALKGGVAKTHIIDGRVPHCLLLEIFTEKGIGTEILSK